MAGQVAHIFRHPIKSHGREELTEVTLTEGQTMPWDRRWAVAHEASKADGSEWVPCANFSRGSKAPGLMAIDAKVDDDSGTVTLTHPNLPLLKFDPDGNCQAFLDWVRPLMPKDRAKSAWVIRVPGRGMTDSDFPSISLNNLSSNQALSQRIGQELSPLRWRGNVWLDGLGAWEEFKWLGKTLRIGQAELYVKERIVRCLATTANPNTGKRDADTLKALNDGWGHQEFGVYAKVTKTGKIALGDTLQVL